MGYLFNRCCCPTQSPPPPPTVTCTSSTGGITNRCVPGGLAPTFRQDHTEDLCDGEGSQHWGDGTHFAPGIYSFAVQFYNFNPGNAIAADMTGIQFDLSWAQQDLGDPEHDGGTLYEWCVKLCDTNTFTPFGNCKATRVQLPEERPYPEFKYTVTTYGGPDDLWGGDATVQSMNLRNLGFVVWLQNKSTLDDSGDIGPGYGNVYLCQWTQTLCWNES